MKNRLIDEKYNKISNSIMVNRIIINITTCRQINIIINFGKV